MNTPIIAGLFILILFRCKCSDANSVNWSRRRSDHSQQCYILYRGHSCRPAYVQTRARFYLYCKSIHAGGGDVISDYPCLQHENGTRCETLLERYFGSYSYFWYDPDSNLSCSYSECSEECSMILHHLKDTWGCCFHELTENFERQSSLVGFTISHHSHTYWHSVE